MRDGIKRRVIPWIVLACIPVVYVLSVFRFNPQYFFGATQDDSLYFSSAKALANHQGYILPSVPGMPVATKYPVLYPWLLSWVWRWNPSYPSNLTDAVALTAAFGVLFLVSCFLYLRGLKGFGDYTALALTFLVALHPILLYYSGGVLSDVPFAALAFTAMLLADETMRPRSGDAKTAGSALLTGIAILMRAFGLPVAAGILAAALARRAWRQALIFCGVLIPFGGAVVWRWVFSVPTIPAASFGTPQETGYRNVWAYYTSYARFWKISVPNTHILWAMLKSNSLLLLHSPSDFFLAPWLTRRNIPSLGLDLLVTAAVFAGIVRQSRGGHWKPIHWVLPFYMALILLWNFPNTERFAFLFLPLFAGGLWFETRHFLTLTYTTFRKTPSLAEKAVAAGLALGVAALLSAMAWNYAGGARPVLSEMASNRSSLLEEKREAYQWLSCCTAPNDLVISYEDPSLYLYTGRQGMRPMVFPTSGEFDPAYMHAALARMTDVAHVIGARYWMIADDDFDLEWEQAGELGRAREKEIEPSLQMVFKSRGRRIRIYRLGCGDNASSRASCP